MDLDDRVQYVILLPLRFNDGRKVPPRLFIQTYGELSEEFGGVTFDSLEVTGFWEHEGKRYEDRHRRVSVTGPDTPEHGKFIREYKERLKERFDQIEIWIERHRIRLI